ncbi:hypothetical protein SAMN06265349_105313 [Flavobacterium resistens]|uniref:Acyl carrier protein n=1 Tax=Flavobacterium resistens TaxID=443612 RepID=A0A521ES52_9FLAO|nr:acyl carrier protein [Flavobacterium resistens]MRX67937.1 acyl carrier protein [Flavobacterium resistens]SMO86749.1 hypothetical protein SAMN06265349_105313 [Flavobacterium resistens]
MDKKSFILKLQNDLELETEINETSILKDLDEWDSMTEMVLIGLVNEEFSVRLNHDDIEKISTVDSLIEIIGFDKFD